MSDAEIQNDELEFEDADFVNASEMTTAPQKTALAQNRPEKPAGQNQTLYLRYILLPIVFMTVTLLGGIRFGAADNSLIFLRPELICLVFAAILLILFYRSGLIDVVGWFSEKFGGVKNVANAAIIFSLFTASVQLFNSLMPEQGILFWLAGFCLFWMLWTNLFAEFEPRRLIRSLAAAFGLLFVVKYLVLANLTAPASENWLRGVLENPSKEAFTWLLDLPRFSPATGYLQFFTIILFILGLYLLPQKTEPRA